MHFFFFLVVLLIEVLVILDIFWWLKGLGGVNCGEEISYYRWEILKMVLSQGKRFL